MSTPLTTFHAPLGPSHDLPARLQLRPDGFRLSLGPGPGLAEERVLELSTAADPFAPQHWAWELLPWGARALSRLPRDAFARFLEDAERHLRVAWDAQPVWGPVSLAGLLQSPRTWPYLGRREEPEGFTLDMLGLRAWVNQARAHLWSLLSPPLVERARGFGADVQWQVYLLMAGDASGRLAQLAAVAPGTLVFALEHARRAGPRGVEAALAFADAVRAGRPLKRALQPLLEDWAVCGARPGGPEELAALAASPPKERRRRMTEQRLLLRRAPAGLPPRLAWLPPPLALVPEDLPEGPALAWWFHVMKAPGALQAWDPSVPRPVQEAFCRWVSAHVAQLCPEDVEVLARRVLGRGRRLTRGCTLQSVSGRRLPPGPFQRAWERHPECQLPGKEKDLQLPHLFEPEERPGLRLQPLRRASELVEEGQRMHHCVGSLVEAAAAGEAFFLHVETAEGPLTVSVRGPAEAPALGRAHGPCNGPLSDTQRQLLLAWWNDVARARGWAPRTDESPHRAELPPNLAELEAWEAGEFDPEVDAEAFNPPDGDEANRLFSLGGEWPDEAPW